MPPSCSGVRNCESRGFGVGMFDLVAEEQRRAADPGQATGLPLSPAWPLSIFLRCRCAADVEARSEHDEASIGAPSLEIGRFFTVY